MEVVISVVKWHCISGGNRRLVVDDSGEKLPGFLLFPMNSPYGVISKYPVYERTDF